MHKPLFLFLMLVSFSFAHAQFVVVTAKDGFANVRDTYLNTTNVKLKTGTILFWSPEYDGPGYLNGWLYINYAKDAFSKNANETGDHMQSNIVHESQVTALDKLEEVSEKEFSVHYETQPFNFKNKKIQWGEGKHYIEKVNGENLFGSDCGLPKTEITKAEAKIGNKKIQIPNRLLLNILGAEGVFRYYRYGATYYAVQKNGDGACVYHVVWAFRNGELVQRLVGRFDWFFE